MRQRPLPGRGNSSNAPPRSANQRPLPRARPISARLSSQNAPPRVARLAGSRARQGSGALGKGKRERGWFSPRVPASVAPSGRGLQVNESSAQLRLLERFPLGVS